MVTTTWLQQQFAHTVLSTCCMVTTTWLQQQFAHTVLATCWMLTCFGVVQLFLHLSELQLCHYKVANRLTAATCGLCV